jgi:hypothetical protein
MIEEITKVVALGASGVASMVLASGTTQGTTDPTHAAQQWYWVSEKFGLLGVVIFGIATFSYLVFPKAVERLFLHLEKLENRNELSRQDFLKELREERKHREIALDGFKSHLENHTRTNADVIRVQTETLVRELKK